MTEIRSLSSLSIIHWISDWPHKILDSLCSFVSFSLVPSHKNKKYCSFKLDLSMLWEKLKNRVHMHVVCFLFFFYETRFFPFLLLSKKRNQFGKCCLSLILCSRFLFGNIFWFWKKRRYSLFLLYVGIPNGKVKYLYMHIAWFYFFLSKLHAFT